MSCRADRECVRKAQILSFLTHTRSALQLNQNFFNRKQFVNVSEIEDLLLTDYRRGPSILHRTIQYHDYLWFLLASYSHVCLLHTSCNAMLVCCFLQQHTKPCSLHNILAFYFQLLIEVFQLVLQYCCLKIHFRFHYLLQI